MVITVAVADVPKFCMKILDAANDSRTALPDSKFKKQFDALGADSSYSTGTYSYPSTVGGVKVANGGFDFSTGEPGGYVQQVLSSCEQRAAIGLFMKV